MRHRKIFLELPGNLWDVTDAIKQQHAKAPTEWDWDKLSEDESSEQSGQPEAAPDQEDSLPF
jgi:hypothetical protein